MLILPAMCYHCGGNVKLISINAIDWHTEILDYDCLNCQTPVHIKLEYEREPIPLADYMKKQA